MTLGSRSGEKCRGGAKSTRDSQRKRVLEKKIVREQAKLQGEKRAKNRVTRENKEKANAGVPVHVRYEADRPCEKKKGMIRVSNWGGGERDPTTRTRKTEKSEHGEPEGINRHQKGHGYVWKKKKQKKG